MSDPNVGEVPSGPPAGPPPARAPWPPPRGEAPTDPLIKDPHPPSRWREVLAVLGIIVSVAIILVAIYPFIDDDDEGEAQGSTTSTTVAEEEVPPAETTSPVTPPVETTSDPNATVPGSDATTLPPAPLAIALAEATCTAPDSTDSRGNRVSFVATNTIDGDASTAWRCAGNGSGQSLTFTLAAPATVTQLGAIPGFAAVDPFNGDDRFVENRRVVSARWSCLAPGGVQTASATQTFADDRQMQVTAVNGFTGCAAIRFEVTGSTPAGRRDFTAVSDVLIGGNV